MSLKWGFDHCILALLKQWREGPNLITDPHNDLLPVGLVAQLVEHCAGIAEVRIRIPLQAWIFRSFSLLLKQR